MRRRPTPSRRLVAVAGAVLASCFAPFSFGQSLAHENGPIVIKQNRNRFEGFVLERIDASLELLAQFENNKHDPDPGEPIKERETLFRQELELSTDSYIGHKNLIDLAADLRFRFEQTTIESDTLADDTDQENYLTLFNVNARILRKSRLPWTVYARRDQSRINRTFAGSLDSTVTEFGTNVAIRSDRAPTRLSYFHRDQRQTGRGNTSDFDLKQDTFSLESNVILSRRQTLALNYTIDVIDQSSPSVRSTTDRRHDANAVHTLKFGRDFRHNLRSSVKYIDRSSTTTLRRFRWDELLQLEHTRQLRSRFSSVYEKHTRDGVDQTFVRGSGQIRHSLFESLTTTLSAGASRNELDGELDNESVHADLFLDYTKNVPYGRLDSGISVGLVDQRNGERGQDVLFDNDAHVFRDPFPIIISRRFIVPGSIVVSDAADIREFSEGIDYTVRVFTDRVEIRRVVGGAIADGEAVLIDYAIGPEPGSDVFTTTTGLSVRYTISEGVLAGLGVNARLSTVTQDVDARDPSLLTFEDRTFVEYGVDYRYEGFYLAVERERLWSDFSPFEATRFEARYTHRTGRRSTITLESTHSVIEFFDDDNRVELVRLRGTWVQHVNPSLNFRLKLTYRDEKDDIAGDSSGFEQQFEVRWRRRQTDVVVSASNSFLDSSTAHNTFQLFSLSIRRSF